MGNPRGMRLHGQKVAVDRSEDTQAQLLRKQRKSEGSVLTQIGAVHAPAGQDRRQIHRPMKRLRALRQSLKLQLFRHIQQPRDTD